MELNRKPSAALRRPTLLLAATLLALGSTAASVHAAAAIACAETETGTPSADLFSFWTSQPVQPGQTVLVSGGGAAWKPGMTVQFARLPDCDPGTPGLAGFPKLDWITADIPASSDMSAFFQLPSGIRKGAYAYRLVSGDERSGGAYVNKPELFSLVGNDGRTATKNGWIQVHGNALAVMGARAPGRTRLVLVKDGVVVANLLTSLTQTMTPAGAIEKNDPKVYFGYRVRNKGTTANNAYRQRFFVPPTVPVGTYEVWYHPGYGGPQTWTKLDKVDSWGNRIDSITVTDAPLDVTKQNLPTIEVSADVSTPMDDRLQAALAAARTAHGGFVVIPPGTHKLTRPIVVPDNVVIKGTGTGKPVRLVFDQEFIGPDNAYQTLMIGEKIDARNWASFSVVGIKIESASARNPCIGINRSKKPAKIWGVTCILKDTLEPTRDKNPRGAPIWGAGWAFPAFWVRDSENVDIFNTISNAPQGIHVYGSSFVMAASNTFRWRSGMGSVEGMAFAHVIESNRFIYDGGPLASNPWIVPGSEPSFYFTARFGNQRDVYLGRNKTETNRVYAPASNGFSRFDTSAGRFFGKAVSSDPATRTVVLADPPQGSIAAFRTNPGDLLFVVSGRGAGQLRTIAKRVVGSPVIQIDRPFEVQLDATSVVQIRNYQGRLLYVQNEFTYDGRWTDYFTSGENIFAENRLGPVIDPVLLATGQASKARTLVQAECLGSNWIGNGPTPAFTLRTQYLDNRIAGAGFGMLSGLPEANPYSGLIDHGQIQRIIRGNTIVKKRSQPAPAFRVSILPRGGEGLLVEGNKGMIAPSIARPRDWAQPTFGLFRENTDLAGATMPSPWTTPGN